MSENENTEKQPEVVDSSENVPPGVFVAVTSTEGTPPRVSLQPVGGIDTLAIPTVLRLAVKAADNEILGGAS